MEARDLGVIELLWRCAAIATVLMLLVIVGGCSMSPSKEWVEAMSKDSATICGRIHVIYGIGNGDGWIYRTNITNGSVTCDEKGMAVTSTPPLLPVGVQVIPVK